MIMKIILLTISILFFAGATHAATMAKGKITKLDSTTSAPGTFAIQIDGAGGYVCNGNPHALSLSYFPDEKSFDRAFSIALVAFTAGYTVELYNNPVSASCPYMNAIRIIKD